MANENLLGQDNAPFIPPGLNRFLPPLLRKVCEPFSENSRERDIVLISAITSLSACFPTVKGLYNSNEIYANLYGFILAPAGNGKSCAKHGIELIRPIQKQIEDENRIALNKYAQIIREWKSHKKEGGIVFDEPAKPNSYHFLLPANISAASLIEELKINEKNGNLIFDSEADTLGTAMKQDWGSGLSELFRKSFEHEPVAISRKLLDEILNIECPKLSILMTGTPNQLYGVIKSLEDGLLSRFFYYKFEADPVWKDVSPNYKSGNLKRYYNSLGQEVLSIFNFFKNQSWEYKVSQEQWKKFNEHQAKTLRECYDKYGSESKAFVLRMGSIAFRLGMIFSCLEFYDNKQEGGVIEASTRSFGLGVRLSMELLPHSLALLEQMQKQRGRMGNMQKRRFLELLPKDEFTISQIEPIISDLGFSKRTAQREIGKLVAKGIIINTRTGYYQKI